MGRHSPYRGVENKNNMTKNQQLIRLKELYKHETDSADINVPTFVAWLKKRGYVMPQPPTPEQVLAKQVVLALKGETREDPLTGEMYKVNLAYTDEDAPTDGWGNGVFWTDIDEAPRFKMKKVVKERRNQVVADLVQLDLFTDRWNRSNPAEEPINVEYDLTFDVMLARSGREEALV